MASPKFTRPATCESCSLHRHAIGFSYPIGPPKGRLAIIGEALGDVEAYVGQPFQGAAGGVLSRVLTRAGISRDEVRIANVISCQPPGNFLVGAPWEHDAIAHCRQYLQPVLDELPDNAVVIPMGGTALDAILNLGGVEGIGVKDFHGTVTRMPGDRLWAVPTFHPSHLQRGAMNLLEIVTQDLLRAVEVSQRGFTRSDYALVVDPQIEWFRAWVTEHLRRVAADPDDFTAWLALDTEFEESIKGQDESEIDVSKASSSPLLRVNVSHSIAEGVTVVYTGEYIREIERLLAGISVHSGIVLAWNKYADWDHLQQAGHTLINIECYDLMWAWHYLQSDLPRGLGFVTPVFSDFGPWKHWAKVKATEGVYAAADGLNTYRNGIGIIRALINAHMWDVFVQDWHERDRYVLRPAHVMGVPADRAALEEFHRDLQTKQAGLLEQIKQAGAAGTMRPKHGYAKRPKSTIIDGVEQPPQPPKSILGAQKGKRKSEAKQDYTQANIQLVERQVARPVQGCTGCGELSIDPDHNCLRPREPGIRQKNRKATQGRPDEPALGSGGAIASPGPKAPAQFSDQLWEIKWFWQLPFNPDSWQQVLSYIDQRGHTPGVSKKTRKATTDAASLKKLAAETNDPLYQRLLDHRAVTKVDGTYAVGTLARLDKHDRVHPEYLPKPSTLRDSAINPNLTNVVADRGTTDPVTGEHRPGLAAGFRKCIVARDGLPPGVQAIEFTAWADRWNVAK